MKKFFKVIYSFLVTDKIFHNNVLLAFITFILTAGSQFIYYQIRNFKWFVPFNNLILYFVAFLAFSFIRQKIFRFIMLSFIMILNFFQMMHLEYFGLRIYPSEIGLFFDQLGEVSLVVFERLSIWVLPIILTIVPIGFLFLVYKYLSHKTYTHIAATYITIIALLFPAVRTFITGNDFGKQPRVRELDGFSLYIVASYYFAKILPAKYFGNFPESASSPKLEFILEQSRIKNIIFIMGESVNPYMMSVFQKNDTENITPFLSSLKNNTNFFARLAYSCGVSTDVSLSLFFNLSFGTQGIQYILSKNQCVFKLAKQAGYTTYFISSQSNKYLRNIIYTLCPEYIDVFKTYENLNSTQSEAMVDDFLLLDELDKIKLKESADKHFVVLHMRGSHDPYNLRYPKNLVTELKLAKPTGEKELRVYHYKHTIYYLDKFFRSLFSKVNEIHENTLVAFTSDHGEILGEDGRWGHVFMHEHVYNVPLILYTPIVNKDIIDSWDLLSYKELTHFDLGIYLIKMIGYKIKNEIRPSKFVILGDNIYGFAGFKTISLDTQSDKEWHYGREISKYK